MKKRLVTVVLMLCMALCLVACGGNGSDKDTQKNNTENSQQDDSQANKDTEEESESESEAGLAYTIKVVDEANNPIAGVMVQLCKDTCLPKMTDANGVAEFPVEELSDEYKAGLTVIPEGYTFDGEKDVYYRDGATEVTFVLKAAQ